MIKLFTHTDLDGVGCAILAQLAFGTENVDIDYCNYNNINSKVEEFYKNYPDYECHITDISVSDELAKNIENSRCPYVLLDHHQTALRLNKYKWCNVKTENICGDEIIKTSGTEMYYEWLVYNGHLKKSYVLDSFVKTVRDYDTWRWTTYEDGIICKQVNNLLYLYGREDFIVWAKDEIYNNEFPKLHKNDVIVLDIKQREIDNYVEYKNKTLRRHNVYGKTCGVVFAENYVSELGNRLCQMNPDLDFVAMIDVSSRKIEYRSIKDDINLGVDIASKIFNGGGHPKAAGSTFPEDFQTYLINDLLKEK